ncbi:MAG: quinoprotein amine dehydrogenase, beta chain-like protein [Candidatus Acididesulfobacter diazotrophicus]|uniref:Quinoprotein amine dehydrogenase, beta chain-like protein n=1 Tax=Candidatus Acididesulfobacter diazotrophicus TaxID=2597226 RepID=A0A519BLI7_9DELT|nr:MAG: quinoprotein amine dehydrogenase, beta chain-like protein [Candidatus Acididesulfobacter diazotrophicus]
MIKKNILSLLVLFLIVISGIIIFIGINKNADAGILINKINKKILKPVNISKNNYKDYIFKLPTGRYISPIGILNKTPNFSTNVVTHGKYIAVVANGATFFQTIIIYNRKTLKEVSQYRAYKQKKFKKRRFKKFKKIVYNPKKARHSSLNKAFSQMVYAKNKNQDLFQGIDFAPNGILYAAGGGVNDIIAIKIKKNGKIKVIKKYYLKWQPFPKNQYPYQYQGHQYQKSYSFHSKHSNAPIGTMAYKHENKPYLFYPDSIAISSNDKYLYTTGLLSNSVAKINLETGKTSYANAGAYPFDIILADHGKRLAVSDWGSDSVTVLNAINLKSVGKILVGKKLSPLSFSPGVNPTGLIQLANTPYVFVTDSNNDKIFEFNTQNLKVVRIFNDAPYPHAPYGSYPDGAAVYKGFMYAVNAGNNDISVFNIKTGKQVGLIPTAWYPTSVIINKGNIYVTNAKGIGSGPNVHFQWVGDMMDGAIEKISINKVMPQLKFWTKVVLHDDLFSLSQRKKRKLADEKIEKFLRKHIKHVVFILRENKTFDEDLGDYSRAGKWADPHFDLYNQKELPNLYKLANDYGLFVNFDADGEVTAQGHQWTTGASDSDFVQRTWTQYYSGRGLVGNPGWTQPLRPLNLKDHYKYMPIYDSLLKLKHWSNPWISYPYGLYIYNDMLKHNTPFEVFGEFISRNRIGNILPAMKKHVDLSSYGWDRFILDTQRAKVFLNFAKNKIAHHKFPSFVYIWLPDDHTAGNRPCYYTPDYYVANNDYATGKIIDYLSHSPIWKNTLVFITEDDAQSGADHINAHRTFAVMISPWVKKGVLIKKFYSQISIVKTIEAIFKIPPMSQWDANTPVINTGWTEKPDMKPYNAVKMQVKPALNPGICKSYIDKMRLKLGKAGFWEAPVNINNADNKNKNKQLRRANNKDLNKKIVNNRNRLKLAELNELHHNKHQKNKQQVYNKNINSSKKIIKKGTNNNNAENYSPTSLLKISGPEQFKQEWIASKGLKSYKKVIGHIKKLAKKEGAPIGDILAGASPD